MNENCDYKSCIKSLNELFQDLIPMLQMMAAHVLFLFRYVFIYL